MKKKYLNNSVLIIIIYTFLLFPFIQQRTYSEVPQWIGLFYKYYALFSSTVIYVFLLIKRQFNPMKKKQWLFWMFWLVYLFSTLLNVHHQISYVLYHAYILLALVSFLFYASKDHLKELLSALSLIYGFFILANWILFMFYPSGFYSTSSYHSGHLLGDDNAIIYVCLPGLICIVCNSILKKEKISLFTWFLIIVTEFTLVKLWSASAVLCLSIFIVGLLYANKTKGPKPNHVMLICFAAIIVAFFGLSTPFVSNFIVNVLHKDITLTYRTIIWKLALQYIMIKPILGHGGYFTQGHFRATFNSWYSFPSHTPYLQMLIDGGMILLIIFCIITFFGFKNASKNKNSLYARVLSLGLGCMLINYITEYSQLYHYMIIISLMLNIEYKAEKQKKITKEENEYEKEIAKI